MIHRILQDPLNGTFALAFGIDFEYSAAPNRGLMTRKPADNPLMLKSILGTEFLTREQIQKIIDCAFYFKSLHEEGRSFPSTLEGKTAIILMFEPSTRTRSSFSLAAKNLKGNTIVLTRETSSTRKGETLMDTAKTIEAMHPDVLILRHPSAGSPHHLDKKLNIPLINAGDGFHEHPTQALLDLMTMQEFKQDLRGLKVLILGDIAHNRTARSDIYALKTMGAKVSVCGPPTLIPPKVEKLGVKVFYDLDVAVKEQDVIMVLRIQFERMTPGQIPSRAEYARFYGVSQTVLKHCKQDVLIMHPGPVNRGVELTNEVIESPRSLILNQVSNGVYIRMAVLHLLTGGEDLSG